MKAFLKKFGDSSKELGNIKSLAICAMMLALRIVLGILSNISLTFLPLPVVKINFTFLPIIIAAYLCGPVCAGIIACFGDILCYLIAPTGGAFLPGITLCYVLEAVIYGIFLYKSELKPKNVIIAKVVDLVICTIPLHSIMMKFFIYPDYPLSLIISCRAAVLVLFAVIEVLIIILIRQPLLKAEAMLRKK